MLASGVAPADIIVVAVRNTYVAPRHVAYFLAYMDIGGLPYPLVAQSLRLFAEQVMPHFK